MAQFDLYLVISIIIITLLVIAIIISSVYAAAFQNRKPPNVKNCPTPKPCPEQVENTTTFDNLTQESCLSGFGDFPINPEEFSISSSAYFSPPSTTPIGGWLSGDAAIISTNPLLEGILLDPTLKNQHNWIHNNSKLYNRGNNIYVSRDITTGYFRSIKMSTTTPENYILVNQVLLRNNMIILYVDSLTSFVLINYSPSTTSVPATVALQLLTNENGVAFDPSVNGPINTPFPASSPFYASQFWRILLPY